MLDLFKFTSIFMTNFFILELFFKNEENMKTFSFLDIYLQTLKLIF